MPHLFAILSAFPLPLENPSPFPRPIVHSPPIQCCTQLSSPPPLKLPSCPFSLRRLTCLPFLSAVTLPPHPFPILQADRSLASYSVLHSSFLSPASQAAIMPILSNMADVTAIPSGGYFQAERCRVSVGPTELMAAEGVSAVAAADDGTGDSIPALAAGYPGAVAAVRVSGAFKQSSVAHGDFLGAVLGTGITRDKVGDVILLEGEGAQVIIAPDLQDFLLSALTAVHRVPVTVQPIALSDLSVSPPRIDTLRTVEASLRLDAVASAAFRLSRSKFTDLIAKGDVRVNWREAAKSGVVLKSGDVVSVRGKGRCKIGEVTTTKKGRFAVEITRYI
ncbi:unnamed protein product [Closterium sp. NIES-53]